MGKVREPQHIVLTFHAGFVTRGGMKAVHQTSDTENTLAARVIRQFQENVTHRSTCGADRTLTAALDAWARKPPDEDLQLFKSMGVLPSTYDSLTRVKLVQIMAVLTRVFGQIGDKSWGLTPSPNPVLPTDVQAGVVMKYAEEGLRLAKAQGATTMEEAAEFAMAALRANEKQIEKDLMAVATDRSERLERIVDDVLMEAGFTVNTIKQFIANLTKYGTAVIIGPCEHPVVSLVLSGAKDSVSYKPALKNVVRFSVPSTIDVYPTAGACTIDDADVCIRVRYAKSELGRAVSITAKGGGWRKEAIEQILLDHPTGVDNASQTFTDAAEKAATMGEVVGTTHKYEGVRWFGLASGKELASYGITSDGFSDIAEDSYHEAEVVVLAGRVIFAKICDPVIGRPVVKTTFYGDDAQFFGWPPALQIDNCQKLMNITMAAIKKQLQLAGLVPLVVEDYSSFVDADRPGAFALAPGKVFLRTANAFSQNAGQQKSPITPVELPRMIREIIALFDAIAKLTDDASGFNRNMLGSGNFAGAARTATGLMQIQEAASIVASFVISNVDATTIVPLLHKVITHINLHHPDKRAKGDPQIIPKGQLSKVMNSAQQQVISAGFQATQSGIMPQLLGPDKLLVAFREYLKSIDFPNADKIIPDESRMEFLSALKDAEMSADLMIKAGGGAPQGEGGGAQPQQAQPQQANKQAGLGTPSGVEARRGAA